MSRWSQLDCDRRLPLCIAVSQDSAARDSRGSAVPLRRFRMQSLGRRGGPWPGGDRVRPLGLAIFCLTTAANVTFQGGPVDRPQSACRQPLFRFVRHLPVGRHGAAHGADLRAGAGQTYTGAAVRPAAKQPFGSALRAEVHGHAVHSCGQRWQILFDDQPDRAEVNAQVTMHDHVAKPAEFAPRDLRLGALDLARQALA